MFVVLHSPLFFFLLTWNSPHKISLCLADNSKLCTKNAELCGFQEDFLNADFALEGNLTECSETQVILPGHLVKQSLFFFFSLFAHTNLVVQAVFRGISITPRELCNGKYQMEVSLNNLNYSVSFPITVTSHVDCTGGFFVDGTLIDSTTGNPIENARIELTSSESHSELMTSSTGSFFFENLTQVFSDQLFLSPFLASVKVMCCIAIRTTTLSSFLEASITPLNFSKKCRSQ
jgi:hypothetical protein